MCPLLCDLLAAEGFGPGTDREAPSCALIEDEGNATRFPRDKVVLGMSLAAGLTKVCCCLCGSPIVAGLSDDGRRAQPEHRDDPHMRGKLSGANFGWPRY